MSKALEGQALLDEADTGRELASMVVLLFDDLRLDSTPAVVRKWFADHHPHVSHGTPMVTIARRLLQAKKGGAK